MLGVRGFVANTDYNWYTYLRARKPPVGEANFWRPRSTTTFGAVRSGEPLFFRLKAPINVIGGFAYFSYFTRLTTRLAWQMYGDANGASTYAAFRRMLEELRGEVTPLVDDFEIGCVLLTECVFFEDDNWLREPADFAHGIQRGKTYDLSQGEGLRIWTECRGRLSGAFSAVSADQPLIASGYGEPVFVRPRLGQRSFRAVIMDCYERRCAVTSERAAPTLEAAHIRQYSERPEHSINNGILLRADIHNLFDSGYVTVTTDYRFEVSKKIKEDFENGRDYYPLHGSLIRLPAKENHHPSKEVLEWHNENRYLG